MDSLFRSLHSFPGCVSPSSWSVPQSRPCCLPGAFLWFLGLLSEAPFEPLHEASLLCLAIKAAFLVAFALGHRISTIHALSFGPGHIRWEQSLSSQSVDFYVVLLLRWSCLGLVPSQSLDLVSGSFQGQEVFFLFLGFLQRRLSEGFSAGGLLVFFKHINFVLS